MNTLLRRIPSVDSCLCALPDNLDIPRPLAADLIREFLEQIRQDILAQNLLDPVCLEPEMMLPSMVEYVRRRGKSRLQPVLNATGVVIHTNLGRSVLAAEAQAAVVRAMGYCNVEMDLDTGRRGSRHSLVRDLVCRLTGAEDALVVNNNAAAVLLMLDTLAKGGEVVVSRGQLVEIGGSFRIPDVMARSGAILREVGTTNRTHVRDYEGALGEETRAVMRVHTSNYAIVGFHAEVEQAQLTALAHSRGIPCLVDLGSGSLVDLSPWKLHSEPTVKEVMEAGADVVTFSGDKLLGGPQAGIIAGKQTYIEQMAKNQLMRALRCDKLTLAALEATLRLYCEPERALQAIPTLRALTMETKQLAAHARRLASCLRREVEHAVAHISLREGTSRAGGGSFPEQNLPTMLVAVVPCAVDASVLRQRLLEGEPALLGRVEEDALLLDVRTLEAGQFPLIARLVGTALAKITR